jgi:hypothetical protein
VLATEIVSRFEEHDGPVLFYEPLDGDSLDDYQGILAIGHNSGNRPHTGNRAIEYQADAIEIDVRLVRGRLEAAHSTPDWYSRSYFTSAHSLDQVWETANGASAINLDLKQSSTAFLDKLFGFLRAHEDPGTHVVLTSRSLNALERASEDYPAATRMLSVAGRQQLQRVLDEPDTRQFADGVSVRADLLDEETAFRLEEQGLLTFAWVVNDLATLNQLVEWGVDGVTTDNLAIIELVTSGRSEGNELRLPLPVTELDPEG